MMHVAKKHKICYLPTALKIAYFGKDYHGLQMQGTVEKDNKLLPLNVPPTIESHLINACLDLNLIHPTEWKEHFSKCGRTDKGVSSFGNVICLKIRDIGNPIHAINSRLPGDIRVVAYTPVIEDFNARFSCTSRTYRYYFLKRNLNIDKMRKSAKCFIGEHDFKYFCKVDENVTNFKRTIFSIVFDLFKIYDNEEIWVAEIKGSAFLWHQIRYTMAALFLIGYELESDISFLIDSQLNEKPVFDMASELGLVL
eukprot:NODE_376_length_8513_cov_1.020086.p5 type:complete len:253 gc:universal NODE_376_length_8513_cov_1.020086:803-45(-)